MGEIGVNRREYLFELDYVDILLITRGYARRHRDLWSASRWQTFYLMSSFVGSDGLRKAGIHKPSDLLKFPWEDEQEERDLPSDEDISELQALMDELNNV